MLGFNGLGQNVGETFVKFASIIFLILFSTRAFSERLENQIFRAGANALRGTVTIEIDDKKCLKSAPLNALAITITSKNPVLELKIFPPRKKFEVDHKFDKGSYTMVLRNESEKVEYDKASLLFSGRDTTLILSQECR